MNRSTLARKLRQRQIDFLRSPKGLSTFGDDQPTQLRRTKAVSGEVIIQSYNKCSCCGEKRLNDKQLSEAIHNANNVDEFFALCDALSVHQ